MTIDARHVINVTDPVRNIAAQAMAELNLNLLHKARPKPKQLIDPDDKAKAKECVLTDLPELLEYISTSRLKKRVTQSGNRSFCWNVMSTSNITNLGLFWLLHLTSL